MTGSQSGTLVEGPPAIAHEEEVRLSLPETTMVIVGSSGMLWALLYGAFRALSG